MMSYPVNSNEEKSKTNTGKLWVVLVGVSHYYYDTKTLIDLEYCADDCKELAEVLKIANQKDRIEMIALYDGGEKNPTRNEVISSIEIFHKAQPVDTILFYFSGHGYLNSNNQPVFCVADTQIENLANTSISLGFILSEIKKSKARNQLIWLDACQAVHSENNETNQNLTGQLLEILNDRALKSEETTNFYVILSCDKKEESIQIKSLKHGLFTYFLIQGLQGKAANKKGEIEVDRLYFYVLERVKNYLEYQKNKKNQTIKNSEQELLEESQTIKAMGGSNKLSFNPRNNLLNKKLCNEKSQTPSRITSGSGKLIIGLATPPHARKALIVDSLWNAIADINLSKILQARGGFEVDYRYLKERENYNVRDTIDSYLQDNDTKTVLLYLAGNIDSTSEPQLVFDAENKISLNWLREQLQTSVVKEIVIIIDRLENQNTLNLIEFLKPNKEKSICLITATTAQPNERKFLQQLTTVLKEVDKTEFWASELITELQLWNQKETNINLDFWLSGTTEVMEILLPEVQRSNDEIFEINICPFKSLKSFDVDDAYFFHGREALIQKIIAKLQSTSFLAVVGASGSGKSSVVKAGVVPQLITQGLCISEQEQFQSCKTWVIRPTDLLQPQNDNILAALANRLQPENRELIEGILHLGVDSFVGWLQQQPQSLSILVIDQFEELFTAAEIDRINFLELIIGAISQTGDRFKVIITLRDDFLKDCLAISQLAPLISSSTILVSPCLDEEEYRQIITQPAKKVGLEVEHELVNLLLQQLEAGSLPLLQFVLEDLHFYRSNGYLTLASYQQNIGELRNILGKKAQETYDKLNSKQQECAKWIFLSLVQLGEGTEDTRRRLQISELIVDKYRDVFDATLQTLIEARLLVVSREITNLAEISGIIGFGTANIPAELKFKAVRLVFSKLIAYSPTEGEDVVTVEVAHEILIRNWDTLRWWLQENRSKLRLMREIEESAKKWQQNEQKFDYLLRGIVLARAEELKRKYSDELSYLSHQFINECIRIAKRRRNWTIGSLSSGLIIALCLTGLATFQWQKALINQINSDITTSEALLASNNHLDALVAGLRAGNQSKKIWKLNSETKIKLVSALNKVYSLIKESNRLEGHSDQIENISISPDGNVIASASRNFTLKLWNRQGKLIQTINNHNPTTKIVFSPDSKIFASIDTDHSIRIWNLQGKLLNTISSYKNRFKKVEFTPDGKKIIAVSFEGIELYNYLGKPIRSFSTKHTIAILFDMREEN
jgi:energy-coupling factor transporter ATP-binding protein EcfA2